MREEGKNRNPLLCVISLINSRQAPSLFLAFTELKPTIFSNRKTEAFEVMAGRNHGIAPILKNFEPATLFFTFFQGCFWITSGREGLSCFSFWHILGHSVLVCSATWLGMYKAARDVTRTIRDRERDVLMNDDDDIVDDNWAMMQLDALKKRHPKRKKMMMICLVMFHSLALFVFARCFSGLRVCNPEGAMRLLF